MKMASVYILPKPAACRETVFAQGPQEKHKQSAGFG
jgi:hypothetical protein